MKTKKAGYIRFLQPILHSLYYTVFPCTDVKPGYASDTAVEPYITWTRKADITEDRVVHPIRVFSVIHL